MTTLIITSFDLTKRNTLKLPAKTEQYLHLNDLALLPECVRIIQNVNRFVVLGGGSNVVLSQRIDALVVDMALKGISLESETDTSYLVRAYAGEPWHDFVFESINQGWCGIENLALIPGTVGAAPVQNIGAYGIEVKDFIESVQAYDLELGQLISLDASVCRFAYRDSLFKRYPSRYIIISVLFKFPKQWQAKLDYPDFKAYPMLLNAPTPQQVFETVCTIRQQKLPDPNLIGNAGSFFKNPIVSLSDYQRLKQQFPDLVAYPVDELHWKLAAGWLIDQLGWKGKNLGPVGVHERQALVLVNRGGAVYEDIVNLSNRIKHDVFDRYGVELVAEPVFVE